MLSEMATALASEAEAGNTEIRANREKLTCLGNRQRIVRGGLHVGFRCGFEYKTHRRVFTCLHLAPLPDLTEVLLASNAYGGATINTRMNLRICLATVVTLCSPAHSQSRPDDSIQQL